MQIYFQHFDLKIPSKISVDTLWVSEHVVCEDTSMIAHTKTHQYMVLNTLWMIMRRKVTEYSHALL